MSILIGSTPNSQPDDVKLARDILKGKVATTGSIELLKSKFSEEVFLFNKGRDSLSFLLKLFNIKEGDEVVTQAFTCVAVVAPILWNSATPIYVDIDPTTFNMDLNLLKKSITERTRAIIIQHTFGNIADIKKVRKIVDNINSKRDKENIIYIIEDCAHIFVRDRSRFNIGKFSDAYFFSFSQDKSISCTQGAMLLLNKSFLRESFLNTARVEYKKIEDISQKEAKYCARYISLWDRIKKNYFKTIIPLSSVTIGKVMILLFRFLGMIKKQASVQTLAYSSPQKMSEIQACLLLNQLGKTWQYNTHRVDIVNTYNTNLNCELKFNSNHNILVRYPLLLENRAEIKMRLKEKGIISGVWYSSVVFPLMEPELLSRVGYKIGSCPKAEECCSKVINLPTSNDVTSLDLANIIDIVNNFAKPFKIN